ncbi:hypothetical protein [Vibrio rumoiensis]|uniref:Lipoprotein n=1 Tax=Vibrio rumoiensis 1S-45 TaxID=1188252 RepID=A0A1E5E3R0_9VIBR|nr:hypothetical protein [Vibrio rumoiensis]OEF26101.1 hypothetical protein A1QC_07460 [Vibrio rumoiensis 1S-45]
MKAFTIPLSFITLLLLTACSSQPQLLAQSEPIEMGSSENQPPSEKLTDEQNFIIDSQQQANENIGQQSAGTYQSKVIAGLTTTLKLNADHTATTVYDYQNGDESLVETGFWQQANEQQINVLMTQHDGQTINALRMFTIDGFQLTAEKEIVNGMEYQLGNNGLILQKMKVEISIIPTQNKMTQGAVNTLPTANIVGRTDYNAKVDATIRDYFTMSRSNPDNNRYRWLTYDINNDNQPELFVLMDWCQSEGCTVLMFENHQGQWQFNSRISATHLPIKVTNYHHFGWRDLIIPNELGKNKTLAYTGVSYPLSVSQGIDGESEPANVTLFSDKINAAQKGIKL